MLLIRGAQVGPVGTNCYYLLDEQTRSAAVIDPGGNCLQLAQLISDGGYQIQMILLTHGHFDHVDGVRDLLAERGPVPVYISQKDYPTCPTGFGMSAIDGLGELEGVHFLQEGDTLMLGEHRIHVLETPGHTPGCLTYQVEEHLFTGDTLFAGSCGRTDFSNSDHRQMMASLRRLCQLKGDYIVYPGHMNITTLSKERKYNPYLRGI